MESQTPVISWRIANSIACHQHRKHRRNRSAAGKPEWAGGGQQLLDAKLHARPASIRGPGTISWLVARTTTAKHSRPTSISIDGTSVQILADDQQGRRRGRDLVQPRRQQILPGGERHAEWPGHGRDRRRLRTPGCKTLRPTPIRTASRWTPATTTRLYPCRPGGQCTTAERQRLHRRVCAAVGGATIRGPDRSRSIRALQIAAN